MERTDVLVIGGSASGIVAAVARHAAQAPALRVARPFNSRSLRSAQSRKRVPSFAVSRQQFMKYPD